MGAHAFLGRAEQIDRLEPDIQFDLGALEQTADRNGKGLAAILALIKARTVGLAGQGVMLADHAAMWADWAVRPYLRLKVFAGLFGVLKVGLVEQGSHTISP